MSNTRQIGDIAVTVIPTGRFALDGGAMFGSVPRVLWEKKIKPDSAHRIPMALNTLLIKAGGKNLLVDTGCGDKEDEKFAAMFDYHPFGKIDELVAAEGVPAGEVDFVLNTHLHFDHAGGNTRIEGDKVVPTFPRARYVVQMGEWEDATRPNERNRASYLEPNFVPLAESRQLDTVQGEAEVVPGVHVIPTGGHTAYHQIVMIEGGGERLVVPTDIIPTTSHLPLPWIMGYDLYPVGTLEAKRRLIKQVVEEGWYVLFYHDPRRPLGKVRQEKGRFILDEVRA